MRSWSWHFGPQIDGASSVVVSSQQGSSLYVVDYNEGRRTFAHVSGPELDYEDLSEVDWDMELHAGSQFVPVAPKHYRKEAA